MQTTGIIRKVDDLGRIVLPVEVRRAMGIQVGTELEILVENRRIVLEKMENCCIFCGFRLSVGLQFSEIFSTIDENYDNRVIVWQILQMSRSSN